MRTIEQVNPQPRTREEILLHGINELAMLAPGSHIDNPVYGALRGIKGYAQSTLDAANSSERV